MSNPNLKQLIASEYKKCAADPIYFMRKYCHIQHPTQGKMLFNLYPFQEKALDDIQSHRYEIILKSRQLGISTLVAGYALHQMTFKEDFNVLVIATSRDVAKNMVTKVRVMYDYLPSWLKEQTDTDNKLSLRFKNGSQIKAISSTPQSGRSEALSLLIFDEAAFIDYIDDIWIAAQQTLATGGRCIALSTPNGTGNWFHKQWKFSEEGSTKAQFNSLRLHWSVHPDRDQSWRDEQDELLGERAAAQECDCLWGESRIKVRDSKTKEEFYITLSELYNTNMIFKQNLQYEISTPSGYQPFTGIRKLEKASHYVISLSNNIVLKCSTTHPFMYNGAEILANKLEVGSLIDSDVPDTQYVTVVNIQLIHKSIELYDIVEVDNGNIFNVDGVVSHNCDFISSGNTLIRGELIKWYEDNQVSEPKEKRGPGGELWVWKDPDYSRDYMLVADVARGDASDYSAFHVVDVEACEQVAEYKGLIGTKEFGNMMVNVATEYNNALLVIENANIGWAAIQPAIDREYNNLYYTYRHEGVTDAAVQLEKGYDIKDKAQMTPGFTTSGKTRPLLISKLDMYSREKSCIIKSQRLVDEWYMFIWKGSRCEAQRGYNDDLTMAWSIGLYIRDYALKLRNDGIELNKNSLRLFQKVGGPSGVYTGNNANAHNSLNMNVNGNEESLKWLL